MAVRELRKSSRSRRQLEVAGEFRFEPLRRVAAGPLLAAEQADHRR